MLEQKFVKFFPWYFGNFETPKFYSEIIWPLVCLQMILWAKYLYFYSYFGKEKMYFKYFYFIFYYCRCDIYNKIQIHNSSVAKFALFNRTTFIKRFDFMPSFQTEGRKSWESHNCFSQTFHAVNKVLHGLKSIHI